MASDFGRGFIYNLVLFAKHCERVVREKEMYEKLKKEGIELKSWNPYSIFFYTATDHLYELEIPEQFKRFKLAKLTQELVDLCFTYRLPMDTGKKATKKEYLKAMELVDEIAFEVDKKLGLRPKKAQWK